MPHVQPDKHVFMERDDLSLATASQTNNADRSSMHALPSDGHLIAASVTLDLFAAPCLATLSFGRGHTGHVLAAGWIRGPGVFSWGGGLHWEGRIALGDNEVEQLFAFVRNDTGATVTLAVEWTVERD